MTININLIKIPMLISTYEHLTKLYCVGHSGDLWIDQSKRNLPNSVSFCASRGVSRYAVIFIVKFRKCWMGVVKHNNKSVDKTTWIHRGIKYIILFVLKSIYSKYIHGILDRCLHHNRFRHCWRHNVVSKANNWSVLKLIFIDQRSDERRRHMSFFRFVYVYLTFDFNHIATSAYNKSIYTCGIN